MAKLQEGAGFISIAQKKPMGEYVGVRPSGQKDQFNFKKKTVQIAKITGRIKQIWSVG